MRIYPSAKISSCLLRLYVLATFCACAAGSSVAQTQAQTEAQTLAQAQSVPVASSTSAASPMVRVLLNRARSLAARGEDDTAIQVWRQVLLADPENTEALAGVATAYRQVGNLAQSEIYVSRLRQVNPNDPHIASIEQMPAQMPRQQQLQQAGRLAMRGQAAQAMEIYRNLFGDQPPDGDVALAYYETESALPAGREGAIAGLRALTARYPADARYAIALGRILTDDPATRAEGIAMLQPYAATDANAARALQQASQWDTQASTAVTPS
ncbi:MAG TPA: tetratricopeptide repeat protein, partial [Acidobacteriaceae bacterium]|nr:tetratricopeptide repeat protein [Acidobacteriaceae bacterium]